MTDHGLVWQRVPGCRACNRKRPTTELGATVSRHDELMATCRAEPLTTGNISRRLATIHEVLRSAALQTPTNCHSEFELGTLRNSQPIEMAVEQMCQCAVELIVLARQICKTVREIGNAASRWRHQDAQLFHWPLVDATWSLFSLGVARGCIGCMYITRARTKELGLDLEG